MRAVAAAVPADLPARLVHRVLQAARRLEPQRRPPLVADAVVVVLRQQPHLRQQQRPHLRLVVVADAAQQPAVQQPVEQLQAAHLAVPPVADVAARQPMRR